MDDYFCEHCVSDHGLKIEIQERGTPLPGLCKVCGALGGRALPATDDRLRMICRALIRLYYSEWQYNHHVGGDHLETLLFGQNAIFSFLAGAASAEEFSGAFSYIEDDWYPASNEGIALGGGYWDGHLLYSLQSRLDHKLTQTLHQAFTVNYFEVEQDLMTLLESLRADVESEIPAGASYARARIGVKERLREGFPPRWVPDYYYLPFSGKAIGRPPLHWATEGRLNRARVSILYLASDAPTAVSELRPHPGHLVSTGLFESTRSVPIADFSNYDIRNFLTDDRLDILHRIVSVDAILNLPVQPERRELYVITQLLSDCIRKLGFEGVAFRSSVAGGTNLACYAPDAFAFVDGSAAVHEVESLSYQLKSKQSVPEVYDEEQYEKDGDDPLATMFEGLARRVRSPDR